MKQNLRNLLTVLALLFLIPVHGQKVSLVKDINTKSNSFSLNPSGFASLNGKLYFGACDKALWYDVWVYDGVSKPQPLSGLTPGYATNSSPKSFITFNNKLYFETKGSVNERNLWEYDGNKFKLIKLLGPGNYDFDAFPPVHKEVIYNNKLFFIAWDQTWTGKMYSYDGNTTTSIGNLTNFYGECIVFKNKIYFNSGLGKLYSYNDTLPPVPVYKDASMTLFGGYNMVIYKGKMYLSSYDSGHGMELWEYDGVNYPKLAADINPGTNGSDPQELAICNDKLYFQAQGPGYGSELWVYDGSASPPTLVADIYPGNSGSYPSFMTAYNNKLFFNAQDQNLGRELMVYDGINPPTAVTDIMPGLEPSDPTDLYVFNNKLFFSALNGIYVNWERHSDLWCYDDINSPHLFKFKQQTTDDSRPRHLTTFNNKFYFFADTLETATGDILWSYDAVSKPAKIKSFSDRVYTYRSDNSIDWNNKLYFAAETESEGKELWIYNGINNFEQRDLYPGVNSGIYDDGPNFTIYNSKLYFVAKRSFSPYDVYSISQSGTIDIAYPSRGGLGQNLKYLTTFQNKLYILAKDNSNTGEYLWNCDGINPPTQMLNTKRYFLTKPIVFKDKLYFNGVLNFNDNVFSLYSWDGVNPPYIVISKKSDYSSSTNPIVFKDKLYLTFSDDNYGNELWAYDGINPCYMVADINQGTRDSNPDKFYIFKDRLYFTANDGIHGYELWSYDGNTLPVLAADVYPGPTNSSPQYLCGYKNKLYFQARGESTGLELFSLCDYTYSSISAIGCNQHIAPSGKVLANTGIYHDTIPNRTGCDSIITINLTLLKTFSTLYPKVCKTYVSPSGKYTWTKSGLYSDTLVNAAGCDSIITINLKILGSSSIINPVACNSYLSPSGKYRWTSSGAYADTIVNTSGCDSIIAINLQILNSSSSIINPIACKTYLSPSGKYRWTSSGAYTDTLVNGAGCDSIIAVNLQILNNSSSIINPVACNSYLSPSGKHRWTSSGAYTDTLVNGAGCDSIIAVNLQILNSSSSIINPVACNSYLSPSGKHRWTSSGAYTDTVANSLGCDSIITVSLQILNSSSSIINPVACKTYLSPSGKHRWTSSGAYADTLVNAAGCDSLIHINLNVITPDVSVSNFPDSLKANAVNVNYQWLNCNNSYLPIEGATNRTFKSSEGGYYAVEINQNSCKDTSLCYSISGYLSIDNTISSSIHIYPNPTKKDINIELGHFCKKLHVRLISNMGSLVKSYYYEMTDKITLDINGIKGMFYLELQIDEEKSKLFKIVIE